MSQKILTGQCASPGEVTGVLRWYKKETVYTKEDIVVLNEWITNTIAPLQHVGGLLSVGGGITCHASIIAREFGVPCVVSVSGLDSLTEGTRVRIDAAAEEIYILD